MAVDNQGRLGDNHSIGPLTLPDLIVLNVNLSMMQTPSVRTGDPTYRVHLSPSVATQDGSR